MSYAFRTTKRRNIRPTELDGSGKECRHSRDDESIRTFAGRRGLVLTTRRDSWLACLLLQLLMMLMMRRCFASAAVSAQLAGQARPRPDCLRVDGVPAK